MSNEIKPCSCKRDKSLWIALGIVIPVTIFLINLLFFRNNLPSTQVLLTIGKYILAFVVLTITGIGAWSFINEYCESIRDKDRNRELLALGLFCSIIFTLILIAVIIYLPLEYNCLNSSNSILSGQYGDYYWRECI